MQEHTPDIPAPPPLSADEREVVARLRAGDEAAFNDLVQRHHHSMVRLAATFVPNLQVAEEVTQEAWLGVLNGLSRFEGRSSLKTWIFRILTNLAKTRGERESRTVSFSSLAIAEMERDEPAVDADRFAAAGNWAMAPKQWETSPEDEALSAEVRKMVSAAMNSLPPAQREVMRLRDIEGWTAPEVCNVLALSETNQRVLLHRARAKVRRALEEYHRGGSG